MDMKDIAPVILAAGEARRIGYPKALLPLAGGNFLTAILDTLLPLGTRQPVIVLGREIPRTVATLQGRPVLTLVNPEPGRGQLSSLQIALREVDVPSVVACLLWPVDHPRVSRALLEALVDLFRRSGALLAVPECGGKRGHPVVLHRDLFAELLALSVDQSAKVVVQRVRHRTVLLPTEEAGTIEDVDYPEDYARLAGCNLQQAIGRHGTADNEP